MIDKLNLAGPGSKYKQEDAEPAGFWAGWWHGMISPIALVISLFNNQVGIYESHNNGKAYDIGFVLGTSPIIIKGLAINVNGNNKDDAEGEA